MRRNTNIRALSGGKGVKSGNKNFFLTNRRIGDVTEPSCLTHDDDYDDDDGDEGDGGDGDCDDDDDDDGDDGDL